VSCFSDDEQCIAFGYKNRQLIDDTADFNVCLIDMNKRLFPDFMRNLFIFYFQFIIHCSFISKTVVNTSLMLCRLFNDLITSLVVILFSNIVSKSI
jgi:hypothetical protein